MLRRGPIQIVNNPPPPEEPPRHTYQAQPATLNENWWEDVTVEYVSYAKRHMHFPHPDPPPVNDPPWRQIGSLRALLHGSSSWDPLGLQEGRGRIVRPAASSVVNVETAQVESDTQAVLNRPASTADGNVLLTAIASEYADSVLTPPSGWTLVFSQTNAVGLGFTLHVYTKTASGEPGTYTWVQDLTGGMLGGVIAIKNSHRGSHVSASGKQNTSGTSHATPSINTSDTDELLITVFVGENMTSWTPPSGMTERFDISNTSTFAMSMDTVLQSAAGATGAKTATSVGSDNGIAAIIAMRRDILSVRFAHANHWIDE